MVFIGIIGWILCAILTLLIVPFIEYFEDRENFNYKKVLAGYLKKHEDDDGFYVGAGIIFVWPFMLAIGIPWLIYEAVSYVVDKLGCKLEESSLKDEKHL